MDARLSRAINVLRFPLTLLVLCIHVERAWCGAVEGWWLKYICNIAVPAFFVISGILFFQGAWSKEKYVHKLRNRISSLLVPYLLWNAIAMLFIIALHPHEYSYSFGNLLAGFWDSHYSFISASGHSPMDFPLWYVRDLMVCCLMSPLYYHAIKYTRCLLPLVSIVLWMTDVNIPIAGISTDSLAFFSLGAYFAILDVNPTRLPKKLALAFATVIVTICILDALVLGESSWFFYAIRFSVLLLIILAFYVAGCDMVATMTRSLTALSGYGFMIYASHALIIKYISHLFYKLDMIPSAVIYFATVLFTAGLCLVIAYILKTKLPRVYKVLGGR